MTYFTRMGKQLPKIIVDQAENAKKDEVSRREFLALCSTYGATAATAYSLLGMAAPAEAASGKMGGHCAYSTGSARPKRSTYI